MKRLKHLIYVITFKILSIPKSSMYKNSFIAGLVIGYFKSNIAKTSIERDVKELEKITDAEYDVEIVLAGVVSSKFFFPVKDKLILDVYHNATLDDNQLLYKDQKITYNRICMRILSIFTSLHINNIYLSAVNTLKILMLDDQRYENNSIAA